MLRRVARTRLPLVARRAPIAAVRIAQAPSPAPVARRSLATAAPATSTNVNYEPAGPDAKRLKKVLIANRWVLLGVHADQQW